MTTRKRNALMRYTIRKYWPIIGASYIVLSVISNHIRGTL